MPKLRVSLQQLRSLGIFEEIDQPEYVYHMANKATAKKILEDGKVKVFDDYVCFFFDDPKYIPVYIYALGLDHGHRYIGTDQRMHVDPPLNHEDTVVLKLKPRRKEVMVWYKETDRIASQIDEKESGLTQDQYEDFAYLKYKCKLCHYENFSFWADQTEVIELTDIEKQYPFEQSLESLTRFIKDNGLEEDKRQYIESHRGKR